MHLALGTILDHEPGRLLWNIVEYPGWEYTQYTHYSHTIHDVRLDVLCSLSVYM